MIYFTVHAYVSLNGITHEYISAASDVTTLKWYYITVYKYNQPAMSSRMAVWRVKQLTVYN